MDPKRLLDKLPQVRAWIDRTLALHEATARPVASCGFTRLPQFYSSDMLSATAVVEVPHVPVPPLADLGLPEFTEFQNGTYDGITYLNTYLVRANRAQDESLHFHELVHVIQWQHLGPDRFLIRASALRKWDVRSEGRSKELGEGEVLFGLLMGARATGK